jgi:hypothetical protein
MNRECILYSRILPSIASGRSFVIQMASHQNKAFWVVSPQATETYFRHSFYLFNFLRFSPNHDPPTQIVQKSNLDLQITVIHHGCQGRQFQQVPMWQVGRVRSIHSPTYCLRFFNIEPATALDASIFLSFQISTSYLHQKMAFRAQEVTVTMSTIHCQTYLHLSRCTCTVDCQRREPAVPFLRPS